MICRAADARDALDEQHPNFDLSLGFDACCTCGAKFSTSVLEVT
jgi:hypothetical protein